MRHWGAVMAALLVVGCDDPTPTSETSGIAASLSSGQSELVPQVVFNT
jgi:hypothetical protein